MWRGRSVISPFMQKLQRTSTSVLNSNSQHHDVDSRHHGVIHRLYILTLVELCYLQQLCYFHHVPIICKQARTRQFHEKKYGTGSFSLKTLQTVLKFSVFPNINGVHWVSHVSSNSQIFLFSLVLPHGIAPAEDLAICLFHTWLKRQAKRLKTKISKSFCPNIRYQVLDFQRFWATPSPIWILIRI